MARWTRFAPNLVVRTSSISSLAAQGMILIHSPTCSTKRMLCCKACGYACERCECYFRQDDSRERHRELWRYDERWPARGVLPAAGVHPQTLRQQAIGNILNPRSSLSLHLVVSRKVV